MAIFCTKCGTSNEDGAGFCDNCGAKLRAPLPSNAPVGLQTGQTGEIPRATGRSKFSKVNRRTAVYGVVVLTSVLLIGGGATYFLTKTPTATPSSLLAAAKAGYGKETTDRFLRELCLSNIDYSISSFNANQNDQRTQTWMNALVTAGLYSPPVAISSGGFFAQTLVQYVATPELEKFRKGTTLCAAKDVAIVEVTDIQKPEEQPLGKNSGLPKILGLKTKLVLRSLDTAPWMEQPDVRNAFMANLHGWEYKGKAFEKRVQEYFGLKDNKWTTGVAYKESLEAQVRDARRKKDLSENEGSSVSVQNSGNGFAAKLSGLFSFGNPLKGTWRTAEQNLSGLGVKVPAGTGPNLTFTADAMESMGQSTNVDFSVDGKRVKVTPKGQSQSLIFVLEDSNTMVAEAMGNVRYERVR